MRIKKVVVKNYGPIKNFCIECEDINVIYGRNEAGKTALIDAITGTLFQKRSIFPGQDRFEKNSSSAEIILTLEHLEKEYTFPGSFKFEDIANLPHYHLASLFIIRAGDLSLKEGDKKWQDKVKEFLSGIPVNIERIKEKIGEDVGLTPGGEWSDRQPMRKKSRMREKEDRKKDLLAAIKRLESIDRKKKILREKKEEREKLREKNKKIKLLRSYILHQRIKKAFSEWSTQKISLQNYERYCKEDYERWLKKEKEQNSLLNLRETYSKELQEIRDDLDKVEKEINSLREEKKSLTFQKDRLVALSLFQDTRKFLSSEEDITQSLIKLPFYSILGSILFLGGVLLFFMKGFKFSSLYTLFSFFLLGAGVYLLIFSHLLRSKKAGLKKLEKSILEKGKQVWPTVGSVNEIIKMCELISSQISGVESKLEYAEKEKEKRLFRLREKEKKLEKIEKEIQKVEDDIKKLRDRTGLPFLSQLEEKLKDKEKIILNIKSNEDILKTSLGTDDPAIWEKEAKREIAKPDIDEKELAREGEIEEKLLNLDNEIHKLTSEIASFTQGELGRLKISETTDIWKELKKVEDEIKLSYLDKEAALVAWNVLDEVGAKMEDILLATVSDKRNGVSFYFHQITSGRYTKVKWDKGSLYVTDRDGKDYPVEVLSSGTQDQLFFSFRLGILKRGFPEGVFILLDDAFLTSDSVRREQQVRVCKVLAEEGWQIFYFTVDEHICNLFYKLCGVEAINL